MFLKVLILFIVALAVQVFCTSHFTLQEDGEKLLLLLKNNTKNDIKNFTKHLNFVKENIVKITNKAITYSRREIRDKILFFYKILGALTRYEEINNAPNFNCIDENKAKLDDIFWREKWNIFKCSENEYTQTSDVIRNAKNDSYSFYFRYQILNESFAACKSNADCQEYIIGRVKYALVEFPISMSKLRIDIDSYVAKSYSRVIDCGINELTKIIDLSTNILEKSSKCLFDSILL